MSRITLRSPVAEEFLAFSAEKSAGDGNAVIVPLPLERIINDIQPTQDAVKNRPQDGMVDAPRNGDGKHAPETPTTNARRPASIFHFNSHMGDAGATPETSRQRHDHANQCSAVYGWHWEKDSSGRRISVPQILRLGGQRTLLIGRFTGHVNGKDCGKVAGDYVAL